MASFPKEYDACFPGVGTDAAKLKVRRSARAGISSDDPFFL